MIGEEQGEQVSCFAYGSPVFCVCSGIFADIAFLIPVIQHRCGIFEPVGRKEVLYGCAVGLIHQNARVGIAKSITTEQTAQWRIICCCWNTALSCQARLPVRSQILSPYPSAL